MNTNQITVFKNETIGEIKGYADENGDLWFQLSKVCDCLALKNTSDTLANLKERHNKFGQSLSDLDIIYLRIFDGVQHRKVAFVSENILYELIFKSEKKKAFDFQQWVFKEVLPSLRKYGEYRMASKMFTKTMHDTIKENIVDKSESPNAKFAYSNYHKMVNKSLGLPSKNDRDNKEVFTPELLGKIANRESLVSALIKEGKTHEQIKDILGNL